MSRVYPFSAYDKQLVLKPGLGFWLTLAFIMRPYIIMMISLANMSDRMAGINMLYGDRSILAVTALASLLAVPVMYALMQRKSTASARVRWLWERGAWFLLGALCTNLLAIGWLLYSEFPEVGMVRLVETFIALMLCLYIFNSRRIKDTFSDFPPESSSASD